MKEELKHIFKDYKEAVEDYVERRHCYSIENLLKNSLRVFMNWVINGYITDELV